MPIGPPFVPGWVSTAVGIVSILQMFSAFAMVAIAICLIMMVKQVIDILKEIKDIITDDVRRDLMPSVAGTLRNVKLITDDAAATTHQVTGTVNKVATLAGAVTTKMESPLIRSVGIISGLLAGARAVSGKKSAPEAPAKKKGGLFGFFK